MTIFTGNKQLIPIKYDHLYLPAKHFIIVGVDNKFGVLNHNNETIVPFEYEHIVMNQPNSSLNYMAARKGDRYGIINTKGEVLIPFLYEYAEIDEYFHKLIQVRANNKWGYINLKNEVIIPIEYDKPFDFLDCIENVRTAVKDGKIGIISPENKILIPCEYEELDYRFSKTNKYLVKQNGKWIYINNAGEVIQIKNKKEKIDKNKRTKVNITNTQLIQTRINKNGEIKIPFRSKVFTRLENRIKLFVLNKKYGFLNQKGQIIVQPKFDGISYSPRSFEDIARVNIRENGKDKFGLIKLTK